MANTKKHCKIGVNLWSIGLAMFAMFFGAGNVTFPVSLGQYSGNNNCFAILGLLITAVVVPFIGLMSMLSFSGDYNEFFSRIGKTPGFVVIVFIMTLIGPLGALPRCIALSYSTLELHLPGVSLSQFGLISCIAIFALSVKKNKIVDVLGLFLTPVLLFSLSTIIIFGFFNSPKAMITDHSKIDIFLYGLIEGYKTMDLFAGFFFSILIVPAVKGALGSDNNDPKQIGILATKSGLIGMGLLAVIYGSMSFVASFHANALIEVPNDKQLGVLARHILGNNAGLIANVSVLLACLTTAITLAVIFTEFIRKEIFKEKMGYNTMLFVTLAISYFVCQLGFTGIMSFISPTLVLICPSLIVLAILNFANKTFSFKPVKIPVYLTFLVTLLIYFLS